MSVLNGWLLLDKPKGITSSDLVVRIRNKLNKLLRIESQNYDQKINIKVNTIKVGHAGTLDPLASGLMLVAYGKATRLIEFVINSDKEYVFTISWGYSTDSYDSEGRILLRSLVRPTKASIEDALLKILPLTTQVPPIYSAIKIGGQKSCDLARKGKAATLETRSVKLFFANIIDYAEEFVTILIKCSKGFYVRSLAHDIAQILGAEGHVSYLHRQTIGKFCVANATPLEYIECIDNIGLIETLSIPLDKVLDDIQVLHLNQEDAVSICHGRTICINKMDDQLFQQNLNKNNKVAVFYQNTLIAICSYDFDVIIPDKVLNCIV